MSDTRIKNMEEFASLSGISRPTLSKYFSDPSSVRASTRAQIEQALQRYDYRPNLFAVNLNKRRSQVVGMVVPDLRDPFYASLVELLEQRCAEAGLFLLALTSRGDPRQEARALETLLSLRIAGAVVAPLGRSPSRPLVASLRARTPVVFLDAYLDSAAPFVGTDNRQSIGLITDYLCRTGEPPTYLDLPPVNTNVAERRAAYREAMERNGHAPLIATVPTRRDWRFETIGYRRASAALDGDAPFPTRTILCGNDRIATGVLAAAFQRGITVGRGPSAALRVAGHDDQPVSRYACPPLTTVAQDVEGLAANALKLLAARMDGPVAPSLPPERILLPATLVIRDSA